LADIGSGEREPRDRATIALVDAKVDGLRDLIQSEIGNIREDIRSLLPLVLQVALMEATLREHGVRLDAAEKAQEDATKSAKAKAQVLATETAAARRADRAYRRINLPTLFFAGVVAIGSLITAITVLIQLFQS
jgi:hypothetical protein